MGMKIFERIFHTIAEVLNICVSMIGFYMYDLSGNPTDLIWAIVFGCQGLILIATRIISDVSAEKRAEDEQISWSRDLNKRISKIEDALEEVRQGQKNRENKEDK